MNIQHQLCNRETIELFLADQLEGEELLAFEDHLGGCPPCRAVLDRIAAEGSWWDEARGYLSASRLSPDEEPTGAEPGPAALAALKNYLAPTDDPRMLGRLGVYEILGVIGWGGMGIVLKGFDPALNRCVALKVLGPQLALAGAAQQRFAREARAAAAVVHDNVVAIHAVAEAGGLPYFVMPYLPGPSLEKRLQQTGAFTVVEVLRIGMQIASGLAAAHAQGLVHRDVKPANILLGEGIERVTLTDFGLARAVDDASLTQSGVIAGTPQYMSPEQARGEPFDHRSDLFSLGSVLYALCTGRPPFRASTTLGVLKRVVEDDPRPIRAVNPDVPDFLAALIARLQAKDPDDRFQCAAEVAALLEGYLAHLRQPGTGTAPVLPPCPAESRFEPGRVEEVAPVVRLTTPRLGSVAVALLLVTLGLGLTHWWLAAAPDDKDAKPVFSQDFRLLDPNSELLRPVGQPGQVDDKGVRITLPANQGVVPASGYMMAFAISGDFEATYSYEVLKVDRPDKGYGVGVSIYAALDPNTNDAVSLAWRSTKEGNTVFMSDRMKLVAGKLIHQTKVRPARRTAGKLRLRRVGSRMSYLVADGPEAEFVKMEELVFGGDDIRLIQVGGNAGNSEAGLDFRMRNLTLRAAGLPGQPAPGQPPPAPVSPAKAVSKGWLVAVEIAGLVVTLALIGLGALLYARRNRGRRSPVATGKPPVATGDTASPLVSFPCPGCGKKIKAGAELAGKKGRCGQCGTGIQVPAGEQPGESSSRGARRT